MLNIDMIDEIISKALFEDIGTGDITTLSTIPAEQRIRGRFIAKEPGVICGLEVIKKVFEKMDKEIMLTFEVNDGSRVNAGDIIAKIEGPAVGILTGERVALNFLQRLSGIATKTAHTVEVVKDTKARITDTRKTTPGLRILEKYAVRTGGGANHRFNLSDGILIKDNHIKAAGSITNAVTAARSNAPHTLKIEVEVESMAQIDEALEAGADIIMLDNMDLDAMKAAVEKIAGHALVEASGNMGDKDLQAVAATGVDLISIGALTHTVKAMDISLRFE
jgi:nicotinate-nucleotide pyrophosphorylase (carboxylating)